MSELQSLPEKERPSGLAHRLETLILETVAKRDAAMSRRERKRYCLQLRAQRFLLRFCVTRAGYADPARRETERG